MFGFEYRLILSMFYVWFQVSFDTQYVLCLVSSIVGYSVCFMFGFEYRLILSMFYVWFRVSFDTQYVLSVVSRYRLILDRLCNVSRLPFRSLYGYCLQGSG